MEININERYIINLNPDQDLLGQGGYADVYKGKDTLLGREIAIKVIQYQYEGFSKEYQAKDLEHEYQVISTLRHPNIVAYYDFVRFSKGQEKFVGIVMDYADFGTLHDFIYQYQANEGEIRQILTGILAGLEYIHDKGIIHRDLKPLNILLQKNEQGDITPLIADFLYAQYPPGSDKEGLAREIAPDITWVAGTVQYMSPERYGSGNGGDRYFIGPMTDFWSFGLMVIECLNRGLPIELRNENTTSQIIENIHNLKLSYPPLPNPYYEIVRLCLVKEFSKRVSDASVLLKLLDKNHTVPAKKNDEIKIYSQTIDQTLLHEIQKIKDTLSELKEEKKALATLDKNQLIQLIKEANIDDCFASLNEGIESIDKDKQKIIILLECKWNDIKQKEFLEIIDSDTILARRNSVKSRLIEFILGLE